MKQSSSLASLEHVERWHPHPVYRFHGGPLDGQDVAVHLIETPTGMIAPDMSTVAVRPHPQCAATLHRYRFQPTGPSGNRGFYVSLESPSTIAAGD